MIRPAGPPVSTGAGLVNQTGGSFSANGSGSVGIILAWQGGYGAYLLSNGTMTVASGSSFAIGDNRGTLGRPSIVRAAGTANFAGTF